MSFDHYCITLFLLCSLQLFETRKLLASDYIFRHDYALNEKEFTPSVSDYSIYKGLFYHTYLLRWLIMGPKIA